MADTEDNSAAQAKSSASDVPVSDRLGFIDKLVGRLQASDEAAATIIIVFLIVIMVAQGQALSGSDDGYQGILKILGIVAGGWVVFRVIKGTILAPMFTKFIGVVMALSLMLMWGQFMTSNAIPYVTHLSCMSNLWEESCPFYSSPADDAGRTEFVVLAPSDSIEIPSPGPSTPPPDPTLQRAKASINIQFAGTMTREMVTTTATALQQAGWNVQGASRGGERTAAAAGLTELRYFSKSYENLALELKQEFEALATGDLQGIRLSLEDVSDEGYNVSPGHLEIWISN